MLIQEITMRNFLSYGPDGDALSLKPLNIIIGPNGSGKSNLMEAMALLRSAPTRFDSLIRKGGRVTEWLWKGGRTSVTAKLEAVIASDALKTALPIRYGFDFTESGGRFEIVDEHIENAEVFPGDAEPYFYYRHENGHPVLNVQLEKNQPGRPKVLRREDVDPEKSIL